MGQSALTGRGLRQEHCPDVNVKVLGLQIQMWYLDLFLLVPFPLLSDKCQPETDRLEL